jgi:hypothetical protein
MKVMNLAMEIFYDDEAGQWGYSVPALSIIGSGCMSREEARRLGYEAIEAVLEETPPASPGAELVLFHVELTPTAEAG